MHYCARAKETNTMANGPKKKSGTTSVGAGVTSGAGEADFAQVRLSVGHAGEATQTVLEQAELLSGGWEGWAA